MSNTCGSCDCSGMSQCGKKGNSFGLDIVETQMSYDDVVMTSAPAAEHDGKCKCGPSCKCTNCTCGQ